MSRTARPSIATTAAAALVLAGCGGAANYAEDRARIEDLQARYLFAMDFHDADAYAATFAEDGVLDFGAGQLKGRDAIRDMVARTRERAATQEPGEGPPKGRHNITSMVITVDGDRAKSVAYWFLMRNDNPERTAQLDSFGHYEDELVKVNGQWLFSLRKIYNEEVPAWAWTSDGNPAVSPGAGPGR
jgi:ketosteroid isomerase-like protein